MERWRKLNVYFGCGGLILFFISIVSLKKMPFLLLSAMFGLGIFIKTFKIIYKGEGPPTTKVTKKSYDTRVKKKKK
ncbi:MAG: hypothetical protein RRZ84_06190 [Romboutsia sp.]